MRTSCGNPWYVTLTCSAVPATGLVVSVNESPADRVIGPSAKVPIRISGPLVSSMIAMYLPSSSAASRIALSLTKCSSCVPCEKLSLAMSMPARIKLCSMGFSELAGPIVQTILVLRIL
ncbi:MAG: hypothetical protein DDT39_01723 [Firmicutes bacterium]|nr:hypothetical protein [candidate division NPL-UPA2 bacterium]